MPRIFIQQHQLGMACVKLNDWCSFGRSDDMKKSVHQTAYSECLGYKKKVNLTVLFYTKELIEAIVSNYIREDDNLYISSFPKKSKYLEFIIIHLHQLLFYSPLISVWHSSLASLSIYIYVYLRSIISNIFIRESEIVAI